MFKQVIFILSNILVIGCSINQDICGKSLSNYNSNGWRIINGQDAKPGEFPWHVLITLSNGTYDPYTDLNFCQGTLIDDQWVLTAGHCIREFGKFSLNASDLAVRLGVHNMSATENTEVDVLIDRVILRENYTQDVFKYQNDIALMKLSQRLDYSGKHRQLRPICLTTNDTKLTDRCVSTGFGKISETQEHPIDGILQKVDQKIVSGDRCAKQYPGQYDDRVQVCIAGRETGPAQFACPGDSGGPVQCLADDGKWHQAGIVSFATGGCKSENHNPVVFTRVSAFIDWIQMSIEN